MVKGWRFAFRQLQQINPDNNFVMQVSDASSMPNQSKPFHSNKKNMNLVSKLLKETNNQEKIQVVN